MQSYLLILCAELEAAWSEFGYASRETRVALARLIAFLETACANQG